MVRRLKSARYVAQNWRIEMEEKKIVETLFVRRSVNVSEQDIDDMYSLEEYSETSCFVENASRRR